MLQKLSERQRITFLKIKNKIMTIQMKTTEQYFPELPFFVLCKLFVLFDPRMKS